MRGRRPVGVLAERHHVDVVVDQDRRVVASGEEVRHPGAVPAAHDRRPHHRPGARLDRPGDADADRPHMPGRVAGLGQQPPHLLVQPGEYGLGPIVDVQFLRGLGQHRAAEFGDRDRAVRGAEVHRAHHRGARGQLEGERRAPAVGRHRAGLHQQPAVDQQVDPLRDGRTRQPGGGGELAAAGGAAGHQTGQLAQRRQLPVPHWCRHLRPPFLGPGPVAPVFMTEGSGNVAIVNRKPGS